MKDVVRLKFSDIKRERWSELKSYLDTALLPLSGLTGSERPYEATETLERLRDALDPLESAFRGRVVTYPALHYAQDDAALADLADKLCVRLKESGFAHCIVIAGQARLLQLSIPHASLLIGPEEQEEQYAVRAKRAVETLWHGAAVSGET